MRLRTGLFCFLLLAAPVVPNAANAADPVTFALSWVPTGQSVPFYVGTDKGFYRKSGLDVTIERGYGSGDTVKRVTMQGAPHFGMATAASIIIGRTKGAQSKIVGIFADKSLTVAYVLSDSGIKSPKDLEGRTIGDSIGGGGVTIFPAFAAINGIKKWEFVPMAPTAKNPSLLSGKVDAILTMHHIYPGLRKKAQKIGKDVHAIRFSEHGLDLYSYGFIARDAFLKAQGDITRRFLKATLDAIAWTAQFPNQAVDLYQNKFPAQDRFAVAGALDIQLDTLDTPFARKHGIGRVDQAKMAKTRDLVAEYFKLKTEIPLDEIYTNDFLDSPVFMKRSKVDY